MSIDHNFDVEAVGGFTMVPNSLVKDERLNDAAFRLMAYLLSRPGHWKVKPTELMTRFSWGKDKTYAALTLVIELGYADRVEHREGGRITGYNYKVRAVPLPSQPLPGKPLPEKPDTENPDISNTDTKQDGQEQYNPGELTLSAPEGHDRDRFEEFWSAYPKRAGSSRKAAEVKFRKAVSRGVRPDRIIAGARRYAEHLRKIDRLGTEFVATVQTWLNQERWDAYDVPTAPAPPPKLSGDNYRKTRPDMSLVTTKADADRLNALPPKERDEALRAMGGTYVP